MQQCWHSDPMKRPTACEIKNIFSRWDSENRKHIGMVEKEKKNPTKIIESPDIGPVTNNPNSIYKSRPLSAMIKSAESTRSLKSQEIGKLFIPIIISIVVLKDNN